MPRLAGVSLLGEICVSSLECSLTLYEQESEKEIHKIHFSISQHGLKNEVKVGTRPHVLQFHEDWLKLYHAKKKPQEEKKQVFCTEYDCLITGQYL